MLKHACVITKYGLGMGAEKGGESSRGKSLRLERNVNRRRVPPKLPPSTDYPADMHGKKTDSKLVAAGLDLELPA